MTHAKDASLIGSVILIDPATGDPTGPGGAVGQKTTAESRSVVIASDQPAVPISGTVSVTGPVGSTQSGSWAVNATPALSAGSTQTLAINRQANLLATPAQAKSTAGRVHYFDVYNPNTSVVFLHFYNATAANVTPGTTTPMWSVPVPAGLQRSDWMPNSFAFSTAITVAATTTATGGTAPATGIYAGIGYI